MGLRDDDGAVRATLVDQLQDVEPSRTAQDIAGLSELQTLHCLQEDIRQASRLAPAHVAALKRVGRIGEAGGDLAEVCTLTNLCERSFHAGAPCLYFLRCRLLGHRHENV